VPDNENRARAIDFALRLNPQSISGLIKDAKQIYDFLTQDADEEENNQSPNNHKGE